MSKLESEQQELNLFFSTTVSTANSPESKRLVAEAPYHPGYEGAVFQTTSLSDDSLFITTNTDPGKDLYNKYNSIFSNTTKSKAQKFDSDKLPVNLLSSEALLQTAAVMKFGANKYNEHNWRSGFAWSRPLAAAMRHIMAFNDGEDKDPESGLSHLAHAMCCIMFLLEFEKTHPELDDRYKVDVPTTKDTSK